LAAQAKADLAELNAKAHADGIVTAEEQRAINDATTKSNNAQTAAINAAAADATAKANAAQTAAISTAAAAAQAKADLAELNAKAHADGIVTAEEQRAINDATTKANNAQTAAINAAAADATAKANAATAVANTAQSTIDNLNISTKNLVSGDGSEILVYGYVTYGALMKRGKEYCGTVMAKSDRTVSPNLYFLDSVTGSFASAGITLTNTYQQFSIRGICPNWWNEATGILILYQSDFSIPIWTKEVSVVEGGKPMLAWMASPEYTTIKIDEAKAKAMEADYLKSALQSSSEANGGLFSTTLIQVRDTDNVVKGGMSGVQNDNVGIWTGGTYADAIAGIAKNIFNKNGNFRIGGGLIDFDVASQIMLISALIRTAVSGDRLEISNSNNSITIYDYAGLEKVKISPKTVSPRGEIGGSTTVTTTTYAAHANTIDEDGTATIGSTETITLDPTKFFTIVTPAVNFSLSASGDYDGINKIHYTGDASVRVSLFDVSKGVSVWESNESVSSSNSSVSEDSGTIGAKTLTGMKGSIYRIDVTISISHEGAGTGLASASISAGQTLTGTIVNTISEIGLNGFNFIKSADEWLHLGDDEFSRRGATDLPGVLATGSVNSSGGLSNEWGAKKRASNVWVTKGGTGIYNVPHQAGSTYSVQITSTTDNLNARVTSRGTNTFQVTVRNMSGTAVDTGSFDFTLYGAN